MQNFILMKLKKMRTEMNIPLITATVLSFRTVRLTIMRNMCSAYRPKNLQIIGYTANM